MTENISHQIFPTTNPSATESQNSETLGRWQLPIRYFTSTSNRRVGKRKLNSLLHYFLQQIHFLRTQIDRRLPGRRRLACPVRLVLAAVFSAELGPSPSEGRLIMVPSIDGGGIRSLVSSNIIAKAWWICHPPFEVWYACSLWNAGAGQAVRVHRGLLQCDWDGTSTYALVTAICGSVENKQPLNAKDINKF